MDLREIAQKLREYFKGNDTIVDIDDHDNGVDLYLNGETLSYSKIVFEEWEKSLNHYQKSGNGFDVHFGIDTSGYEYWSKQQEEDVHACIVLYVEKELSEEQYADALNKIEEAVDWYAVLLDKLHEKNLQKTEDVNTLCDKVDKADMELKNLIRNIKTQKTEDVDSLCIKIDTVNTELQNLIKSLSQPVLVEDYKDTIYDPKLIEQAYKIEKDWYKSEGAEEDEQLPEMMLFVIEDNEIKETKKVDRYTFYDYNAADNEYMLWRTRDTGWAIEDYNLCAAKDIVKVWKESKMLHDKNDIKESLNSLVEQALEDEEELDISDGARAVAKYYGVSETDVKDLGEDANDYYLNKVVVKKDNKKITVLVSNDDYNINRAVEDCMENLFDDLTVPEFVEKVIPYLPGDVEDYISISDIWKTNSDGDEWDIESQITDGALDGVFGSDFQGSVDIKKLSQDVIDRYGAGHELATYDGETKTQEFDDDTYYIFVQDVENILEEDVNTLCDKVDKVDTELKDFIKKVKNEDYKASDFEDLNSQDIHFHGVQKDGTINFICYNLQGKEIERTVLTDYSDIEVYAYTDTFDKREVHLMVKPKADLSIQDIEKVVVKTRKELDYKLSVNETILDDIENIEKFYADDLKDSESLDNIWTIREFTDNLDSKDGKTLCKYTKIGLIDFINDEIKLQAEDADDTEYTLIDREITNRDLMSYLEYLPTEAELVSISNYDINNLYDEPNQPKED